MLHSCKKEGTIATFFNFAEESNYLITYAYVANFTTR